MSFHGSFLLCIRDGVAAYARSAWRDLVSRVPSVMGSCHSGEKRGDFSPQRIRSVPGIKGDRVVLKEAFPLRKPAFEMLAVGRHTVYDG